MTSSMATGDKKWASSTRRSGMIVLGKVAVPKPINLPSQKLENHGNDPNVEIVPKGTLSWGSRSSPSNAWGSSSHTLNTDNGRPSSGGSGTRPSTAGSEKAFESTNNAWGSNSRPSSASGSLASNQASGTSLRPRSADTRPGSSQLSRFAEHSSENSGAWAAAGSADNMVHPKKDNFSLSSGDFPTLGSEKENPAKNDHSQPLDDDAVSNARVSNENISSGVRDGPSYAEDGSRSNMDKWHGDQQHQNLNMPGPPQHFASWHGAPMGSPPVWYRGPTGGPPYVTPGVPPYGPPYGPSGAPPYGSAGGPPYGPILGPGGFPMEHPYYHPPAPPNALGNSQPVPLHGAGPRGPHQKNGEMYRPHMPDIHFRPGMPMRPGFFPGPVPYEGFYPPPMGYPNDRDGAFMGPAGPAVYDRHKIPNTPDRGSSQSASGGRTTTERIPGPEPVLGHRHEHHEQYKVLLKPKGEEHEWGDNATAVESRFERGHHHRPTSGGQNRGREFHSNEKTEPARMPANEGRPNRGSFTHGGPQFPGREMSPQIVRSPKGLTNVAQKLEDKPSHPVEVLAPLKDSTLIQKIEGLNAKTRGTDGKQDVASCTGWNDGKTRLNINATAPHSTNAANNSPISHARTYGIRPASHGNSPMSHGIVASTENRYLGPSVASGPNFSRRPSNNVPQIRTDYHGKGKSEFSEGEGQHKKAHISHTLTSDSSSKSGSLNSEHVDRGHINVEKSELSLEGKDTVLDSATSLSDPIDIQAQRAKMREIAKQRAKERQREEEERIKEQRAKAQAKLEELDRRTQMNENCSSKLEIVSDGGVTSSKPDEDQPGPGVSVSIAGAPKPAPTSEIQSVKPNDSSNSIQTRQSQPEVLKDGHYESALADRQQIAQQTDAYDSKGAPEQYRSINASKPKLKAFKEKQKIQPGNFAIEKTAPTLADAGNETMDEVARNTPATAEPLVQHRLKNNRSGKNKPKVEESSSLAVLPPATAKDKDPMDVSVDTDRSLPARLVAPNHIELQIGSQDWPLTTETHASLSKEESQIRVNSRTQHQNSRRQPRSQQGNRVVDKTHIIDTVIWAPVKQQHKEVTEESSHKGASEEACDLTRIGDILQGNTKNKRAEMERYVPKPVAKELAQQGGAQQPASTVDQAVPDQADKIDSSASKLGMAAEHYSGELKHNRQPRAPGGAWRQRVSAETSVDQGQGDGSLSYSDVSKGVPKHTEQNQMANPDSLGRKEVSKSSDGWNSPDEWSNHKSNVHDASIQVDQGSSGRGKRQYNKGSRNMGTNAHDHEHGRGHSGKVVDVGQSHLTAPDSGERERITSQEKQPRRGQENPSANWQTSPRDFAAQNHQGSRPGGSGQNLGVDTGRFAKKDPAPHGNHQQPRDHGNHHHPKDIKVIDRAANRPSAHSKNFAGEFANTEHQDGSGRLERKVIRGSNSSNLVSRAQVEQAPLLPPPHHVEHQHERPRSSTGMRKNGNHQNNRFGKGHEPLGDWNPNEQDSRYHNQPSGRGRQRHNNGNSNSSTHYEYKPKGQSHSSAGRDGGNFQYQRQAASDRVEAVAPTKATGRET